MNLTLRPGTPADAERCGAPGRLLNAGRARYSRLLQSDLGKGERTLGLRLNVGPIEVRHRP